MGGCAAGLDGAGVAAVAVAGSGVADGSVGLPLGLIGVPACVKM